MPKDIFVPHDFLSRLDIQSQREYVNFCKSVVRADILNSRKYAEFLHPGIEFVHRRVCEYFMDHRIDELNIEDLDRVSDVYIGTRRICVQSGIPEDEACALYLM